MVATSVKEMEYLLNSYNTSDDMEFYDNCCDLIADYICKDILISKSCCAIGGEVNNCYINRRGESYDTIEKILILV